MASGFIRGIERYFRHGFWFLGDHCANPTKRLVQSIAIEMWVLFGVSFSAVATALWDL
jgi:hypothetical protein